MAALSYDEERFPRRNQEISILLTSTTVRIQFSRKTQEFTFPDTLVAGHPAQEYSAIPDAQRNTARVRGGDVLGCEVIRLLSRRKLQQTPTWVRSAEGKHATGPAFGIVLAPP